jgi:hypothetical protein
MGKIRLVYVLFGISPRIWNELRTYTEVPLYCTVFVFFNPVIKPHVQYWRYLTTLRHVYVSYHFWTPKCNVLGYWRHHSVCYTSLFTTPLVVTTISVYSVWPSDVVSRSGTLISSLLSVRWSLFSLSFRCLFYLCLSSLYLSPLKSSVCAWNWWHLPSRLHFLCSGFPTIWLLRRRHIRTRPLSSNLQFWGTAKSVTLYSKTWL